MRRAACSLFFIPFIMAVILSVPSPGAETVRSGIFIFERVFFTGKKFLLLGSFDGSWIGDSIGSGAAFISDDGKSFRKVNIPESPVPFRAGASDGKRILIAGDSINTSDKVTHNSVMYLSTDGGIRWREVPGVYGRRSVNSPAFRDTFPVDILEFQNGYFTALTADGGVFLSANGKQWKRLDVTISEPTGSIIAGGRMIVWGNEGSICIGEGIKWKKVSIGNLTGIRSIFYDGGVYTGYGEHDCCYGEIPGGITKFRFISKDIVNWKTVKMDKFPSPVVKRVTVNRNTLAGISGNKIFSGSSLSELKEVYSGDEEFSDIVCGKGTAVAAGSKGTVLYSVDGKEWTQSDLIKN